MVQIRKTSNIVLIIGVLVKAIAAQNITASTCVSPDGFNTCYDEALGVHTSCVATYAGDLDGLAACDCGLASGQIFCALASCWNVIYGCEYQILAATLASSCLADPQDIPYYPIPEDAPGGCACNIGYIVGNVTNSVAYGNTCVAQTTGLNAGRDYGCGCCASSGVLTSIFSICPDVSPEYMGYPAIDVQLANQESVVESCASVLDQYDCVNDLDFAPIGMDSYLSTVPSSTGTLSPSTIGETLTTPPYGSSYVVTLNSATTTITPAKATDGVTDGSSGSGQGSSQATGLKPGNIYLHLFGLGLIVVYLAMV